MALGPDAASENDQTQRRKSAENGDLFTRRARKLTAPAKIYRREDSPSRVDFTDTVLHSRRLSVGRSTTRALLSTINITKLLANVPTEDSKPSCAQR